jgi:subtilisin family serine protease
MKKNPLTVPRLLAVASLALFTFGCTGDNPLAPDVQPPLFSASGGSEATPTDQHVVTMQGGIPADFADRIAAMGGIVFRIHPEIGVAVTSGLTDQAAAELARTRGVSGIERDIMVQWIPTAEEFAVTTDDAPAGETDQSGASSFAVWQWNLRQIAADQAWLTTNQGQGTKVAVLDTGTDPNHPDLIGKIDLVNSTSVLSSPTICDIVLGVPDQATFFDFNFHGSFVSGIIASNGLRVASVAPDATIIGVKVLDCTGSGSFGDIIAGIIHATNVGADVINMSLGGYFPKNLPGGGPLVAALNRATNYANRNGVLVVASAGNQGLDLDKDKNFTHVPSQSANVLSVGATGPTNQVNFDQLAYYTNFGVSGVDVTAPGGNAGASGLNLDGIRSVCSTFSVFYACSGPHPSGNGWNLVGAEGTSFAAPHAAGTAAVVKSDFPGKNPAQLEHCVIKGADDLGKKGTDDQYSKGRINVVGAAGC